LETQIFRGQKRLKKGVGKYAVKISAFILRCAFKKYIKAYF